MPRAGNAAVPVMIDRTAAVPSIRRTLTALGRYRHLLRNLVFKDLKLKYRGSVIGFVWSLANPLVMAAVYTFAFRYILKVGSPDFVFYLMLGLLAWTFFSASLSMSTGSIVDNGGLLRSVWFPRAILPMATVLFNLSQYLLTVLVFLPLMFLYYEVPLAPPMLLFPVVVLLQTAFTIGLALILATGTVLFRDVRHLVDVALAVLIWTTPIVYRLSEIDGWNRRLIQLSPLTPFVTAYHDIFYYRQWPAAGLWIQALGYTLAALALGLWLLVRYEDTFPERV